MHYYSGEHCRYGILKNPACFPDSIIGSTPHPKKADIRFVKYCLDSYKLQIQAISGGTTQDNLSLEKLQTIKFRKIDLPIQRKIAAILSAYDDLIENNNRRIAILEKMAEEIYREWFVRMRFPGHEKAKFHKGVSAGWELRKLGDLVKTQYGYTASADEKEIGPKFLRITDIAQEKISWANVPHCRIEEKEVDRYLLREGDILVHVQGQPLGTPRESTNSIPKQFLRHFWYVLSQ